MENKLKESRKSNRKRGSRKEEKREFRRMKDLKNEEISAWPQFPVADMENAVGIVEQEISLDPENLDNGESKMLCSFFYLRYYLELLFGESACLLRNICKDAIIL